MYKGFVLERSKNQARHLEATTRFVDDIINSQAPPPTNIAIDILWTSKTGRLAVL